MKKTLFTLSLFALALASVNLHAEIGLQPDNQFEKANPGFGVEVMPFCESARTQAALKVITDCKDREDWAACVTGQEDKNDRIAYVKVCKLPEGEFLQSLNPCECLAAIQKRDASCGTDIVCEVKNAEEPTQPEAPVVPPTNQGKNPNAAGPLPQMSGSGCSLGAMAGSVDGLAWIAGLGFLIPGLIRRRG